MPFVTVPFEIFVPLIAVWAPVNPLSLPRYLGVLGLGVRTGPAFTRLDLGPLGVFLVRMCAFRLGIRIFPSGNVCDDAPVC